MKIVVRILSIAILAFGFLNNHWVALIAGLGFWMWAECIESNKKDEDICK